MPVGTPRRHRNITHSQQLSNERCHLLIKIGLAAGQGTIKIENDDSPLIQLVDPAHDPTTVAISIHSHKEASRIINSTEREIDLENYVKACELSDVPAGTMFPVDVEERRIMIVNADGTLYAVDRICTHETADLSTGFLRGEEVTCPLHLSRFDVKTGTVQNPPATTPLGTYKLKTEGTTVYVQI